VRANRAAIVAVLAAASLAYLLLRLIAYNKLSDMPFHAMMAATAVQLGVPFAHPMFFAVAAALAGWTRDWRAILDVIPPLLTLAFAVSMSQSIWMVRRHAGVGANRDYSATQRWFQWGLIASVVAVFFSFSLPTSSIYLGQFPPMVWHNSTITFMTPFAIGLFLLSQRFVEMPTMRAASWIMLALTLCALAKPSFAMSWIPAFPIFVLLRTRAMRPVLIAAALSAYAAVLVGLQSLYLFSGTARNLYDVAEKQVGFPIGAGRVHWDPFAVWTAFTPLPWLSVIASTFLVIVGLGVYRLRLLRSPLFQLAGILYLFGLSIFALLAMDGPTFKYGDLIWQMIPITLIIFLSVVAQVWREINRQGRASGGDLIVFAALGVHVLAFVNYMHHYMVTGTYG
jgi:hypothetical protein